jgi:hypothetical protein
MDVGREGDVSRGEDVAVGFAFEVGVEVEVEVEVGVGVGVDGRSTHAHKTTKAPPRAMRRRALRALCNN